MPCIVAFADYLDRTYCTLHKSLLLTVPIDTTSKRGEDHLVRQAVTLPNGFIITFFLEEQDSLYSH